MARFGKRSLLWQALTDCQSLMRSARYRHLAGRTDHELTARQFLDQIGVGRTRPHERDTAFQPRPCILGLGELLALNAEARLYVGQRQQAALAPNRVVAEIGDDRETDRGQHGNAEETGDAAPDSHTLNESRTDSRGQAKRG